MPKWKLAGKIRGKDGKTPIKGVDYFDGEKGEPGESIVGEPGLNGADGSPDTPGMIRDKLEFLKGDDRLEVKAIKGLNSRINRLKKRGSSVGGAGIVTGRMVGGASADQFLITDGGSKLSSVDKSTYATKAYVDALDHTLDIGDAVGSGTSGSVLFVDSSNQLAQDNDKLFWDATNFRLGIGTNAPQESLHILDGSLELESTASQFSPALKLTGISGGNPVSSSFIYDADNNRFTISNADLQVSDGYGFNIGARSQMSVFTTDSNILKIRGIGGIKLLNTTNLPDDTALSFGASDDVLIDYDSGLMTDGGLDIDLTGVANSNFRISSTGITNNFTIDGATGYIGLFHDAPIYPFHIITPTGINAVMTFETPDAANAQLNFINATATYHIRNTSTGTFTIRQGGGTHSGNVFDIALDGDITLNASNHPRNVVFDADSTSAVMTFDSTNESLNFIDDKAISLGSGRDVLIDYDSAGYFNINSLTKSNLITIGDGTIANSPDGEVVINGIPAAWDNATLSVYGNDTIPNGGSNDAIRAISTNDSGCRAIFARATTTAAGGDLRVMGLNAFATVDGAGNFTNTTPGIMGGRYATRLTASFTAGNTISQACGVTATIDRQSGNPGGDITWGKIFNVEDMNSPTTGLTAGTVANLAGLYVSNMVPVNFAGTPASCVTNSHGIYIEEQTGGTSINNEIFLAGGGEIFFRDQAIHLGSLTDGHLDLTADVSIDLNADVVCSGDVQGATLTAGDGFTGTGAYTNFTIVNGIITNAS